MNDRSIHGPRVRPAPRLLTVLAALEVLGAACAKGDAAAPPPERPPLLPLAVVDGFADSLNGVHHAVVLAQQG